MAIAAILFIAVGITLLVATKKGQSYDNCASIVLGIYFIIMGGLIGICMIRQNDGLLAYVLGLGIGGLFIAIGLYNIYHVFVCTQKVQGTYCGAKEYAGKVTLYAPVFAYLWEGKKYERQCSESYKKRFLKRRYEEGKTYAIFIDRKNPQDFVIRRRVGLGTLNLLVMGVLFCMVPIQYVKL